MVDVPNVSFFSVEGGLIVEANKFKSINIKFKEAKRRLKRFTPKEFKLHSKDLVEGKSKEYNSFLTEFQNAYFLLLSAYKLSMQEVQKILDKTSQENYEILLSLKTIIKLVEKLGEEHKDWFMYEEGELVALRRTLTKEMQKFDERFVKDYANIDYGSTYNRGTLLRIKSLFRSDPSIEKHAMSKIYRLRSTHKKAKEKDEKIRVAVKSGKPFLNLLGGYFKLLDKLNLLTHMIVMDMVFVFNNLTNEFDGLLVYYVTLINLIVDGDKKKVIKDKHIEVATYLGQFRRNFKDQKWFNVYSSLKGNLTTDLNDLMDLLNKRSWEGEKAKKARENKEKSDFYKREVAARKIEIHTYKKFSKFFLKVYKKVKRFDLTYSAFSGTLLKGYINDIKDTVSHISSGELKDISKAGIKTIATVDIKDIKKLSARNSPVTNRARSNFKVNAKNFFVMLRSDLNKVLRSESIQFLDEIHEIIMELSRELGELNQYISKIRDLTTRFSERKEDFLYTLDSDISFFISENKRKVKEAKQEAKEAKAKAKGDAKEAKAARKEKKYASKDKDPAWVDDDDKTKEDTDKTHVMRIRLPPKNKK